MAYLDRVNSLYNYNYTSMRSSVNDFNQAGGAQKTETNKPLPSYVNNDALEYLSGIQNGANRLLRTLADDSRSQVFSQMQDVVSSDRRAVAVDDSGRNDSFRETGLDVEQIATRQVNEGARLDADAESAAEAGTNSFQITQGGQTFDFNIEVEEGDTNAAVQQRIADAVNGSGIGVRASVSQDENGMSRLSLESESTGEENAFVVRDTVGSLAADTGMNSRDQAAQDAIFRVNGGQEQRSATNNVALEGGVSVTFRRPTDVGEPVTVGFRNGSNDQAEAMRELVGDINNLLSAADRGPVDNRVEFDLRTLLSDYGSELENVGVRMGGDGRLSIDAERLSAAARDGALSNLMGSNSGFASGLTRIASFASSDSGASSVAAANSASGRGYYWNSADDNYWNPANPYSTRSAGRSGFDYNSTESMNRPGFDYDEWRRSWQESMERNNSDGNSFRNQWREGINNYRNNMNSYAYLYNSPGAVMNMYA